MAMNQEPPCPAQAQRLKREVSETQINGFLPHAAPSPLLRCTLRPRIHWIQSPPHLKASLSLRSSLTCPLQFTLMGPCLRHRPNISHCSMAQFPAETLSIPPLNRWPCFRSPCVTCNGLSAALESGPPTSLSLSLQAHFPGCCPWLYILECIVPLVGMASLLVSA